MEILHLRNQPFDGVKELFEYITGEYGAKIAITTGYPPEFREICEKGLGRLVEHVSVSISPKKGKGRPAPYMIFEAMERTDTKSVIDVLNIGDTISDVLSGQNAGVDTVALYETGAHRLVDFVNMHPLPIYIIPGISYLRERILEKK